MEPETRICRKTRRRLKAWLDGEIAPRLAWEIDRHLETCGACRRAAEDFRQLGDLLRRADPGPVARADLAGIRAAVVVAQRDAQRTVRFLQRTAAAAAAVLILASVAAAWPWIRPAGPAGGLVERSDQVAIEEVQDEALATFLGASDFTLTPAAGEGGF